MNYTIQDRTLNFITILESPLNATVFHHFKNKDYKILCIGINSETLRDEVVYQQQYPPFAIYVRDSEMFFSLVDKKKYPEVAQKYRFEVVNHV